MLRFARPLVLSLVTLAAAACSGSTGSTGGIAVAGGTCPTDGAQATATDGCNLCECSGGTWSCSDVACAAGCSDGDRRDDGCNVCICDASRWSCTRAQCGETEACTDGATRTSDDGCNSCSCEGGHWACTQRDCSPPPECSDGETMSDGCNSCTCSGGLWACTDVACPPAQCTDGDVMNAECGTCRCAGGQWACTNAACPPPVCVDGDTTTGTCEMCTCSAGQWLCSAMPCVEPVCPAPAPPDPNIGCTAVEVTARDPDTGACCTYGTPCQAPAGWEQFNTPDECRASLGCVPGDRIPAPDGCNTCACTVDGSWACTEMACVDQVACGGWLGDTCLDTEFCAYAPGQLCGGADASAFCAPIPASCDLVSQPVCGCDGLTYGNACLAAQARTGVLDLGPCIQAF